MVSPSERGELRRRDVDGERLEGRDDCGARSNLETPPSIIIQLGRESTHQEVSAARDAVNEKYQ